MCLHCVRAGILANNQEEQKYLINIAKLRSSPALSPTVIVGEAANNRALLSPSWTQFKAKMAGDVTASYGPRGK